MPAKDKIRVNTRYVFYSIAAMIITFVVLVLVMMVPMGMNGYERLWAVRVILYIMLVFALLGGVFSLRVAFLQKKERVK